MAVETSIAVYGRAGEYTLIVEPWAEEHQIHPGDHCAVVVHHPTSTAPFGAELWNGVLIISVEIGDATYEFRRNGTLEFTTSVPIPW